MEPTYISNSHNKHHAIILPLPLQGHINPAINLSLKLASSHNFTITFLTFDFIQHQITQVRPNNGESEDIFCRVRQGPNGLDIRSQPISDGLPLDYDRQGVKLLEAVGWYLDGGMFDYVIKGIEDVVLKSKPNVDVLIIDTFYPWGSKIAKKFGLRYVSFWTEPALVFNIYWHLDLLRKHGHFDCEDARKDPIDYIPGIDSIEPKNLMSYLQDKDITTNMHKLIFKAFEDVRTADVVLCNTIHELEPDTISALQGLLPFYAIGPTFQLDSSPNNVISASLWAESNCLEWLDAKRKSSVLYVSFGSLANLNKNDVLEIAYGLMESNIDFVWVLRPGTVLQDYDNLLPDGFEQAINGRGFIVPWTNQNTILSHPVVGGFLTHCGWNSVLESIWHEIPMLCFPIFTDQFPNRKLVVDDWKIGVNLSKENQFNRREIVENIKSFIKQEKRDGLRENINLVKEVLANALGEGGSSAQNMNLFVAKLDIM